MLGGHFQRLAEAEAIDPREQRRIDAPLAFVRGEDDFFPARCSARAMISVAGGDAGARVDDEKADISLGKGLHGLGGHAPAKAFGVAFLETGGVDKLEQRRRRIRLRRHGGRRAHAGRVVDEGELLAGEPVEQRRFSDIGPSHDSKGKRRIDGPCA